MLAGFSLDRLIAPTHTHTDLFVQRDLIYQTFIFNQYHEARFTESVEKCDTTFINV